jgi:cytoskeletal protein CcmA (bactofilin family)
MLGNKNKGNFSASSATTLVSQDAEIIGDIKFAGNLDIEGTVRGNIIAESGKDAVVRIVEKGLVEGEIHAPSVIINGTVKGDVHSSKHLELAAKARVQGNVQYTLVEMAVGAEVNGALKHASDAPAREPAKRESVAADAMPGHGATPQPAR